MSRYKVRTKRRNQIDDYLIKDKECKNCKSNNRNKPDMILKINTCGHSYCAECVHSVFRTGQAACTIDNCGYLLKQAKFRPREFEDETLDKEMHFRKLIEKVYNKQQDEFESVLDFNQYVEDKEEKIYSLTYGNSFRMKDLLKEIDDFQKENTKNIRKNNEELSRKRKEWKIEVDKMKEYDEFIVKKFREEDQSKITKNSVSKHDVDLINKIQQQSKSDVNELVKYHQQQQEHEEKRLENEEKLEKEEADRMKQEEENLEPQNLGIDQPVQKRGNLRGFLNRKKFDSEMETRKVEEPWEYKYSCSFLPRRKDGYPWIRSKEEVVYAGYDKLVPVTDALKEWVGNSIAIDRTSIAQRQVNDAMTGL